MENKTLLTILLLSVFLMSFTNAIVYETPGAVTDCDCSEQVCNATTLNETIDNSSKTLSESLFLNLWPFIILVGLFTFASFIIEILKTSKKKKLERKNIETESEKQDPTSDKEVDELISDLGLEDVKEEIKGEGETNGQSQNVEENTTEKEESTDGE